MQNKIELELEIKKFADIIKTDRPKYFSLLSTMAKFHKYSTKQQMGLCLRAPESFTACATEEQWKKFYGRNLSDNAVGLPLLEDSSTSKIRTVYDVKDTLATWKEGKKPDLLWQYNDKDHGKIVHEVVNGSAETPEKVVFLCKKLAEKAGSDSKELLATNTAYIVLSRLGYDPQIHMKEDLGKITTENQDIEAILAETNELAKQVLNPIGVYIKNERRNSNEQQYENTLLRSLGQTFGTIPAERTTGEIPGNATGGDVEGISSEYGRGIQQEIFDFSGTDDEEGKRDGGNEGEKSDGVGPTGQQHSVESTGNIDGGNLPIEPGNVLKNKHDKNVETAFQRLYEEFGMGKKEEKSEKSQTTIPEYDGKAAKGGFSKQVFYENLAAIRVLKQLEKEEREATAEERSVLQGYAGFGGLPDAFDESVSAWKEEYQALKEVLTEEEYRAARASTLTAHFTSDVVIANMYQGLKNLGFEKGTILEPSCGSGRFFANMPEEMSKQSHIYGVELDSLTGRLAQKIYPNVNITVQGFETTKYTNGSFDLAIGNVPFGEYKIQDPAYKTENFLIHDYFLAKMIDQVRPGGMVAVITSKGTMDKKDPKVREYLAKRGELVKAIRLPNDAFKAAGTEVTADILIFKKT